MYIMDKIKNLNYEHLISTQFLKELYFEIWKRLLR